LASRFTRQPLPYVSHRKENIIKISRVFSVLLVVVFMLALVGPAFAAPICSDPLGCVTIGPSDPIHIAYALVTTGPDASLGIDARNGVDIAIDDSGGKILGHNIKFDGQDDGCSTAGGLAAGTALAADPSIVAVIGTSCSSAASAAMPLLSAAGFVMVSPSNTRLDLTELGNPNNYPGYLRTAINDKVQGATAAQFAWEFLGITTAATIRDGSLYAYYVQQVFADEFKNLGGTITAQNVIAPDQTDMSTVLTSIAAGAPELLYFPVFMPAGGYIISQARATAGLESVYLMGADGLWTEDVVTVTGEDVEGFMVTSPDLSKFSAAYTTTFLPAYRARFGDPISIVHAHAYDAFMLIKAAIQKVAVVDPDGTIQIGRQALRDAMYGTKNFPGLTGNLTCSATGDCADPHIAVYKYHTGQFPPVYIWPTSFTDVSFNYWASSWIERLYRAGITTGCGTNPLSYCPEQSVTRAQMAIFLERGIHGAAYIPPAGTGLVFADVPFSYWAVNWVEKLFADGITTGCSTSPLSYCPEDSVTRAQMAVFLLRAKHGAAYIPPTVGGSTGFNDVPVTHWAAAWIKQLAAEGITTGCGSGNYCPEDSVTRAQMAVFLVRTFNLP
jgi:branched-chain amino acid transport system substrate-binding protein